MGRGARCPWLERLEDRTTPSTFLVANTQDAGDGSLRWALSQANVNPGDDLITFSPELAGATIELATGSLVVSDAAGRTEVAGLGAAALTVVTAAEGDFSVFEVSPDALLDLSGLTISGGPNYQFDSPAAVSNQGSAILSNCTLAGNGTAVSNYELSSATLTNCTLSDNDIAVSNFGNTALTNCTLTDNYNAVINYYSSSATLTNCTLTGNFTAVDNEGGSATLTNCTLRSNDIAVGNNYDYSENGGTATLTNCVLRGNGTAVFNRGSATLTNCTLTDNFTAISILEFGGATLTNCIVWGNGRLGVEPIYSGVSVSYSVVQGGWDGEGNSAADPLFADAVRGDFRLLPGSPAIDAGSDFTLPATDPAGNPRLVDGDRDGKAVVDLGAFEFGRPFVTLTSIASERTATSDKVQVTLSDPVADLTADDFTTTNATVSDFSGDGSNYSFTLTPTRLGAFSVRLAAGVAHDGSGSPSSASNTLMGRTTPLTFLVANAQDSGEGSLRWALDQANGHPGDDVITFSPELAGATIELATGSLVVSDAAGRTEVAGLGAAALTVVTAAEGDFSVFEVSPDALLDLSGLTISGGPNYQFDSPAAVSNQGSAILSNCTLAGNGTAVSNYHSGSATLANCTLSDNGTAVSNDYFGSATLVNCTLSGNGTAIQNWYDFYSGSSSTMATLTNCTLSGNGTAIENGGGDTTFTNCTLSDNDIAVSNFGNTALTNCTLTDNFTAVFNYYSGSATLTNCTLTDNGAAVANGGGDSTLTNCTLTRNGTAVSNDESDYGYGFGRVTLTNCTLTGNDNAVANGGGDSTLTNCTLTSNGTAVSIQEPYYGYGFGSANLTNCTLTGNDTAVSNNGGDATLTNCTLTGNGTAVSNYESYLFGTSSIASLTNCTLTSNDTAVSNDGGTATLTNCILTSNGTGIANYVSEFNFDGASATLTNCTLAGNRGAAVSNGNGGSATLTNCIVWGTARAGGPPISGYNRTAVSVSHSIVQGGWAGPGNRAANPLFADAARSDFRLLPGSPAIDAGQRDNLPDTDRAGNPRLADGNRDGKAVVDLGAYEYARPAVTLSSAAPALTRTAIRVQVAFSDPVADFTADDVTTTNATVSDFSGSGTNYSFTLTPTSQEAFSAWVAPGAAHDGTGNASAASNLLQFAQSAVTLSSAAPALTRTAIRVQVAFSDPVADFTADDVTATNATVSDFSGSGTSYSFSLTPIDQGKFSARLAPKVAHDQSGTANPASYLLQRTFDSVSPTLTDSRWPGGVNVGNVRNVALGGLVDEEVAFTATFTDRFHHTVLAKKAMGPSGNWSIRGIDLRGLADGPITCRIVARDLAGNQTVLTRTINKSVPQRLGFQLGPVPVEMNAPLPAIVVQLLDGLGRPVALAGWIVTISLPGGGLGGTLTARTDANGRAVFSDLKVLTAGTYRLRVSSPGLPDAWSELFAVAEDASSLARRFPGWDHLPAGLRAALLRLPSPWR